MVGNPYLGIISGLPVQAQTSRAGSKMKTSSRGCTPLLETSVYSVGYRKQKWKSPLMDHGTSDSGSFLFHNLRHWTDEFCDCRDLGTICCLLTEENLCARHYWKRLREMPTQDLVAGAKKPAESVRLSDHRSEFEA